MLRNGHFRINQNQKLFFSQNRSYLQEDEDVVHHVEVDFVAIFEDLIYQLLSYVCVGWCLERSSVVCFSKYPRQLDHDGEGEVSVVQDISDLFDHEVDLLLLHIRSSHQLIFLG